MRHNLILMAKSKKNSQNGDEGYCVAGIDTDTGEWIRLNIRGEYSIPKSVFRYSDGSEPEVLDALSVVLDSKDSNNEFQPENYYCKIDTLEKESLNCREIVVNRLLKDKEHKVVFYNHHNYVKANELRDNVNSYYSLMVIEPEDFKIYKADNNKIRAYFCFNDIEYRTFRITDSEFLKRCENLQNNSWHKLDFTPIIVLSITEALANWNSGTEECWKLIAAVIDKADIPKDTPKPAIPVVDNPTLYNQLNDLRFSKAQEEGVPAFYIFSNKSLEDMCNKLPINEKEFLKIHGVGARKLELYGAEFLELIQRYVEQNNIIKRRNSLIDLLGAIHEGIDPLTGEVYDIDTLMEDEDFQLAVRELYKRYGKAKKSNTSPRTNITKSKYSYSDWEERYPGYVVVRKEGFYYTSRNSSAEMIHSLLGYRLATDRAGNYLTGGTSIEVIIEALKSANVKYIVIENDEITAVHDDGECCE